MKLLTFHAMISDGYKLNSVSRIVRLTLRSVLIVLRFSLLPASIVFPRQTKTGGYVFNCIVPIQVDICLSCFVCRFSLCEQASCCCVWLRHYYGN